MTAFPATCAWVIQVCVVGKVVISLPLSSATSAHDQRVRSLALLTSPVAQRRLAPRCERVPAGCVMRFAATVRMVDRVHGDASALRPLALVAVAAGLADLDVLALGVRDRSHGRAALAADHSDLGRREAQADHRALLRDNLDRRSRGATKLAALAGNQ